MKTAEVALSQWAMGEIAIDLGMGRMKFTTEQFTHICDYLKQSSTMSIDYYIQVTDALGQNWDVQFRTFCKEDQAKKVRDVLEGRGKRDQFVPRMAIQFETLTEVIKWAKGEIESAIQIYVPPVESWMKPIK